MTKQSIVAHTPGPWIPNLHHTKDYAGRTHAFIMAVGAIVPVAAVVLGVEGCSQDEGRANARLIAAAPELLAFAQYVADMDDGNPAPLFEKARAAIAKATGGAA